MRRRLGLLGLPLLLSGLLLAQQEAPPPESDPEAAAAPEPPADALPATAATLLVGSEQRPLAVLLAEDGARFPLAQLAPALGGELRPGPGGIGWTLVTGEVESILAPGSRLCTVGREIVELSAPVRADPSGPWVPLDLLRRTFGEALRWELGWSDLERRLTAVVHQQRQLAVDWNLVHLQGISTLVLQFPETPRLRVHPGKPLPDGRQRVEVELMGDQLAAPLRPPELSDPLVQGLAFGGGRIAIDVAAGAVVEHYQQQGPFRLVFDVYQRVAAGPETPASAPPRPTIVIDPGHGGGETGAVGPSGTQEKELTLLLAQSLARELERRLPVRVELTRDEDADLPLDTRAAIANQHRAQLFISIHLNSSLGAHAHGAETYFLSLDASDARAAAAAQAENRAPAPGAAEAAPAADDPALADLQLILWDLAQTRHLAESQRFANLVQQELNGALGLRDRGVKQAPFRVLMGAAMPAVLVELGFLSNPEEERKLLAADYRGQLVDALVRAISRYQGRPQPAGEDAPRAAATGR